MNLFKLFAAIILFIFISASMNSHDYSFAVANAQERPKIPTGTFGCSAAVRKFEEWSKGFEHAAIAVGRAPTITGIKGCNYTWNRKSRAIAERDALRGCKRNRFRRGKCEIAKSN